MAGAGRGMTEKTKAGASEEDARHCGTVRANRCGRSRPNPPCAQAALREAAFASRAAPAILINSANATASVAAISARALRSSAT